MLVGDVLLSAREAAPDLPGTLPDPGDNDVTFTPVSSANPLFGVGGGTLYVEFTYNSLWGETNPTDEASIVLTGGQAILVNAANSPYLNSIAAVTVYTGIASGAEIRQYKLLLTPANPTATIDSTTPFNLAPPPQGSSAFLLDSGGPVASASQLFRWLNDALNLIAIANGGVPDVCGNPTTLGKANYVTPGDWKNIDAAWYDGYPVMLGENKQVYRHNPLTSVSGMMSWTQIADRLVVELFPQPVRTAGSGVTSAALSAVGDSVVTTGFNGFVLSFGLIQFYSSNGTEFVSYTAQNNSIISMVRGLGGTKAQAWPSGTNFREINSMFIGWRAPILYFPGDASTPLTIPSDWVPLIHKYLLSRYRLMEQQTEEATQLEQEFMSGMGKATKRKSPVGDRQIQPLDSTMVDVFPGLSRTFGGLIIP